MDILKKDEINGLDLSNLDIVNDTMTRLRKGLTVICAEGLDYNEVVTLLRT